MVGRGVMLECLDHNDITDVLCIVRKPLEESHAKLKQLSLEDFSDFTPVKDQLTGFDACYHCMGVSAARLNEAQYTHMTYNFSMALAKALFEISPEMTFIYVSGVGTDSTEKSRQMWARVKGKTENDILKLGFKNAFMYRPGAIVPLRGIKSRTAIYQFMYNYMGWLLWIMKKTSPDSVTDTTKIGLSMINISKHGFDKSILTPKDINSTGS